MKILVVDLDGTLCNCSHREEHARAGMWEEFHSHLMDDTVNEAVLEVLRAWDWLGKEHECIALTGRSDNWLPLTERWLLEHDVPVDEVLMRPVGDWRPDHVLKPAMLADWLGRNGLTQEDVSVILEDRDKVVEAWRNLGYSCWQVQPGGY